MHNKSLISLYTTQYHGTVWLMIYMLHTLCLKNAQPLTKRTDFDNFLVDGMSITLDTDCKYYFPFTACNQYLRLSTYHMPKIIKISSCVSKLQQMKGGALDTAAVSCAIITIIIKGLMLESVTMWLLAVFQLL